jgi:hypothetical protein
MLPHDAFVLFKSFLHGIWHAAQAKLTRLGIKPFFANIPAYLTIRTFQKSSARCVLCGVLCSGKERIGERNK